uniref:Uncharacterized protein n=1 Tax=Arundo donax TaxID=35708 RepID=A0A0A8ZYN1_ARUDO
MWSSKFLTQWLLPRTPCATHNIKKNTGFLE